MKIVMILGLMFMCSIQPYLMIISMMLMTLVYSMYMYYSMDSYWYSYMFVLVILSGVLVLFTYIASLIPNEKFEYMMLIYVGMFICLPILMKFNYFMFFYMDFSKVILKLWEMTVSIYNLYLVMLLLLIMLMVVWLSNFDNGAVRNIYYSAWLKG